MEGPDVKAQWIKCQVVRSRVRAWIARTAAASYLLGRTSSHLGAPTGRRQAVLAGGRGHVAAEPQSQPPRAVYDRFVHVSSEFMESGDYSSPALFCAILAFSCHWPPPAARSPLSPPLDGKALNRAGPIGGNGGSGNAGMRSRASFISWQFVPSGQTFPIPCASGRAGGSLWSNPVPACASAAVSATLWDPSPDRGPRTHFGLKPRGGSAAMQRASSTLPGLGQSRRRSTAEFSPTTAEFSPSDGRGLKRRNEGQEMGSVPAS